MRRWIVWRVDGVGPWAAGTKYGDSQEWFATWRDAFDHAFREARMEQSLEALYELSGGDPLG